MKFLGRTIGKKNARMSTRTKDFQLLPNICDVLLSLWKTHLLCNNSNEICNRKETSALFPHKYAIFIEIPSERERDRHFGCFGCWATNKWVKLFHSTFHSFSLYVWVSSSVGTLKCITSGDLAHGIGHRKKMYAKKTYARAHTHTCNAREQNERREINKTNNRMKFVVP